LSASLPGRCANNQQQPHPTISPYIPHTPYNPYKATAANKNANWRVKKFETTAVQTGKQKLIA